MTVQRSHFEWAANTSLRFVRTISHLHALSSRISWRPNHLSPLFHTFFALTPCMLQRLAGGWMADEDTLPGGMPGAPSSGSISYGAQPRPVSQQSTQVCFTPHLARAHSRHNRVQRPFPAHMPVLRRRNSRGSASSKRRGARSGCNHQVPHKLVPLQCMPIR